MDSQRYFEELWELDWGIGIFFDKPTITESYFVTHGYIPHEYFFYACPKVDSFSKLHLSEIEQEFHQIGRSPAIYLTQKQQQLGFIEELIRAGYKLHDSECWVGYESQKYTNSPVRSDVIVGNLENYSDFREVSMEVFADFANEQNYLDIQEEVLKGSKGHEGVNSEIYLIYENSIPVCVGGMFYSEKYNFAYLHNGGTRKPFRNKGYQTDLINFRTQRAAKLGINRIYAITSRGGSSWSNFLKIGYSEIQQLILLSK